MGASKSDLPSGSMINAGVDRGSEGCLMVAHAFSVPWYVHQVNSVSSSCVRWICVWVSVVVELCIACVRKVTGVWKTGVLTACSSNTCVVDVPRKHEE